MAEKDHSWRATRDGPHGEYMARCVVCGTTEFEPNVPCVGRIRKDAEVYVIMGNDFPSGVMTDKEAAEKLCADRMAAQKKEAKSPHESPRIYWRVYEFNLNAIGD